MYVYQGRTLLNNGTVGMNRLKDGDSVVARAIGAGTINAFTTCILLRLPGDWSRGLKVHFLVGPNETTTSLQFRLWLKNSKYAPSAVTLWSGLEASGDGMQCGHVLREQEKVKRNLNGDGSLDLEARQKYKRPDPIKDSKRLSRLQAVQQIFNSFVNRTEAYDHPHYISLMLFSTTIVRACYFTPLYEKFKESVDGASEGGDTALFDCIEAARVDLERFRDAKPQHKGALLRILVLSDGEDTKSILEPHVVARGVRAAKIVVDCVSIGNEQNDALRGIVAATGGLAFKPASLHECLRLCELETVQSLRARPPPAPSTAPLVSRQALLQLARSKAYDDIDNTPGRHEPLLDLPVRTLAATVADPATADGGDSGDGDGEAGCVAAEADAAAARAAEGCEEANTGAGAPSRDTLRRLGRELKGLLQAPHSAVSVFPSTNALFWRAVIEGPEGTVYAGGAWLLYVKFPVNYPDAPPELKFVTKILHCNINAHGRVCHSILDRNWSSDSSVKVVLQCVYGLLLNPDTGTRSLPLGACAAFFRPANPLGEAHAFVLVGLWCNARSCGFAVAVCVTADPLDSTLALSFYEGGTYETAIVEHTRLHGAQRSRLEWEVALEASGAGWPERLGTAGAFKTAATAAYRVGDRVEAKAVRPQLFPVRTI